MSITIAGVVIATIVGVNMLSKELGRKTIFNILSKPVARWEFILGKFCGLVATLTIVVACMCATLVGVLALFEGRLDPGLVVASAVALIELALVVAIALFFSAFVVTPTLAGMFTVAAFVAGRSVGYLTFFTGEGHGPVTRAVARTLYWVLPHLDRLNVADHLVYGDPVGGTYLLTMAAYAAAYAGVLLLLTVGLFARREFV
jgi:ABC-type transport system involved in multi-copper enzyme maturation permease subunit